MLFGATAPGCSTWRKTRQEIGGFFFVWRFCWALVVLSDHGLRPNSTYNGGMRILIIEDNPDILANLYAYLEPKGHVLDPAMNGYAGLAFPASAINY